MKNTEQEKEQKKDNSFVRDDRKRKGTGKKAAYLACIIAIAFLGILDREEERRKW